MGTLPCLITLAVCGIAVIALMVELSSRRKASQQALEQAHQDYQTGLARLKHEPTNADFKQQALQLGRLYANLTREQKGVTVFDEVALSNDISAATAGATAPAPVQSAASAEERLHALDALRSKGLISDAEYAAKRQKLIDEM